MSLSLTLGLPLGFGRRLLAGLPFLLNVVDSTLFDSVVIKRRFDGVFGQHRAVKFDGRQTQLFGNYRVLNLQRFVDGLAFDPFGGQRAAGDGRTATECLETGVDYLSVFVHFDLQFHNITTSGCTDQTSAHSFFFLVEWAHISRVLVVIDHLLDETDRYWETINAEEAIVGTFSW